jgi:hypothetical protein
MALIKIEHIHAMNRPITVQKKYEPPRAMRRLIVDVIRGRDSAARSNAGRVSAKMAAEAAARFAGTYDWTIAVGALNPFACFTIVNGDALGAPRTNKVDSHPQIQITLRRAP